MNSYTQPAWHTRLPGEQWVLMDSPQAAEAYLSTYSPSVATIHREAFPNPEGLYARISFPDRVLQNRVYVNLSEADSASST